MMDHSSIRLPGNCPSKKKKKAQHLSYQVYIIELIMSQLQPAYGVPITKRNTRSNSVVLSISSENVQFLKLTLEKIFHLQPLCAESIISLFPSLVSGEFMPLLFPLMMRVFSIQHYQCAATSVFLQCVREQVSVTQDFAAFNLSQ